jgi:hypothetical protein
MIGCGFLGGMEIAISNIEEEEDYRKAYLWEVQSKTQRAEPEPPLLEKMSRRIVQRGKR